jgi:hypothetical protein
LAAHLGWKKDRVSKLKKQLIGKGLITRAQWDALVSPDVGANEDF